MITIFQLLDEEGLEIARRAEAEKREFTPIESQRLHFINSLATWVMVARARRRLNKDRELAYA